MSNTKIKVAINGLGRIGRAFLKIAVTRPEFEIVAVNDLAELDNLAYLLKYDTAYGKWDKEVQVNDGQLVVDGQTIKFTSEREPQNLPWRDLGVDVVVEATGVFASFNKAKAHLDAGAKKVVVSAPVKDDPPAGVVGATILMGVNDERLSVCQISSNASCTTNSASPLIKILNDALGVEKAVLNTIHGYTASQKLVDGPDSKAITELDGKFDGIAVRVPVVTGSLVDVTFIAKRQTSVTEVNQILTEAAKDPNWQKIFTVTTEPLVSSDIVGSSYASIADLGFTKVVDGNLVKVLAWYDNEMGYTHTLIEHVIKAGGVS